MQYEDSLILDHDSYDCAKLMRWHADCAYMIMWRADCIINFVFIFFKGTHG